MTLSHIPEVGDKYTLNRPGWTAEVTAFNDEKMEDGEYVVYPVRVTVRNGVNSVTECDAGYTAGGRYYENEPEFGLNMVALIGDNHAERIRACIAKYKASKPAFDRATWCPKAGDKVRILYSGYSSEAATGHFEGDIAAIGNKPPGVDHGAYLDACGSRWFHQYCNLEPI